MVGEHYKLLCTISKTPDTYVEIILKSQPVTSIMSKRLSLVSSANILRSDLDLCFGNKCSSVMRSRGYRKACGENELSQQKGKFFYKTC